MASIIEKSRDKVVLNTVYIDKDYSLHGQATNYVVKGLVDTKGSANVDDFYTAIIHTDSDKVLCILWANMMGYDVVSHDEFCREFAKVLGYN